MNENVWVVSVEDSILSKLEWSKGRQSDLQFNDALGIVVLQWKILDLEYMKKWAKILGIDETLKFLLDKASEFVNEDHA